MTKRRMTPFHLLGTILIILCPSSMAFDQPFRTSLLACNDSELSLKSIKEDLGSTKVKECCPSNQIDCVPSEIACPETCRNFKLGDLVGQIQASDVKIDEHNGNITLDVDGLKTTYVHDYCAAYECSIFSQSWEIGFSICICPQREDLVKDIIVDGIKLEPCCPSNFFLQSENEDEIQCPFDEHSKVQNVIKREFNHNETFGTIEWYPNGEKDKYQDSHICYGRSWPDWQFEYLSHFVRTWAIIEKRKPCNGVSPCLRYCHSDDKDKVKGLIDSDHEVDQAPPNERNNCPASSNAFFERNDDLNKQKNRIQDKICIDSIEVQNEKFVLKDSNGLELVRENEFCLTFHDMRTDGGNTLKAEYCKEYPSDPFKFNVYPAFLIMSSISLALTLLAFIFVKELTHTKTRRNVAEQLNYNLLTRQYVFSLLIGMVGLTATQLHSFHGPFCKFFSYNHLFFFLSSFSIMSQMSLELVYMCTWFKKKRYILQLLAGYGIPATICICACIVDIFASTCSWIKPGLGEHTCFIKGVAATGFWFYLPIGLSLIFNAVCFAKFLRSSTLSKEDMERLGKIAVERQKERKWTFAKIFIASGFTWFFEILSGLIGGTEFLWYLSDIFNMLQGVYIFALFICKKSVLKQVHEVCFPKKKRNHEVTQKMQQETITTSV